MLEYISKINGFSLSVTCEAFAKVKTKPIYNSEATNPTNKYYTYREIIGFIAACNGCNAQFDANDKLIFARPSNSVETIEEGACESLSVAQDSGFIVKAYALQSAPIQRSILMQTVLLMTRLCRECLKQLILLQQ